MCKRVVWRVIVYLPYAYCSNKVDLMKGGDRMSVQLKQFIIKKSEIIFKKSEIIESAIDIIEEALGDKEMITMNVQETATGYLFSNPIQNVELSKLDLMNDFGAHSKPEAVALSIMEKVFEEIIYPKNVL